MRKIDPARFDWFPLYFRRILASARYQGMKDFQQAWYVNLLFNAADSERPGYLRLDGQLWRLAKARTERFFEQNNAAVMACFERSEFDGQVWIFNRRLLGEIDKIFHTNPQKQENISLFSSELVVGFDLVSPDEFGKVIDRLFAYYREKLNKRADYTLTDKRRKKAMARLHECLKSNSGNIGAAEIVMREAIQNLADSEWNVAHGHTDWLDHIFNTEEVFQKRLERKPEAKKASDGDTGKYQPKKVTTLECFSTLCKKRFDPNKEPEALPFCGAICKKEYGAFMATKRAAAKC